VPTEFNYTDLITRLNEFRPVMKWNGNHFVVDSGGGGQGEDDGVAFQLPYWMGHHGLLRGEWQKAPARFDSNVPGET